MEIIEIKPIDTIGKLTYDNINVLGSMGDNFQEKLLNNVLKKIIIIKNIMRFFSLKNEL